MMLQSMHIQGVYNNNLQSNTGKYTSILKNEYGTGNVFKIGTACTLLCLIVTTSY